MCQFISLSLHNHCKLAIFQIRLLYESHNLCSSRLYKLIYVHYEHNGKCLYKNCVNWKTFKSLNTAISFFPKLSKRSLTKCSQIKYVHICIILIYVHNSMVIFFLMTYCHFKNGSLWIKSLSSIPGAWRTLRTRSRSTTTTGTGASTGESYTRRSPTTNSTSATRLDYISSYCGGDTFLLLFYQ